MRWRRERLAQQLGERARDTAHRNGAELAALIELQLAEGDVAQSVRFLQDRVEHWCQIARRAVDHLQDLGGRSLPLQSVALLCQQPCILDSDHRLVRKGADELDVPFVKGFNALARQYNDPDSLP